MKMMTGVKINPKIMIVILPGPSVLMTLPTMMRSHSDKNPKRGIRAIERGIGVFPSGRGFSISLTPWVVKQML